MEDILNPVWMLSEGRDGGKEVHVSKIPCLHISLLNAILE
jgi:hypothetical protein